MDIPVNADVWCTDGLCGRSVEVIVDPATERVTHLAVRESHEPHVTRLVAVERVVEATPHLIRLDCTSEELAGMEDFIDPEYITLWSESPYPAVSMPTVVTLAHERIPSGELAIHRGAQVEATDGHIGRVDEFLIDPTSERITHLVLREGHLWGQKDVTIPISQIDRIEEDKICLWLDKHSVGVLPAVPIRRQAR